MFSEFSEELEERMRLLETIDRQDRTDGTGRDQRLRQITRETGQFLSLLLVNAPAGDIIEIGTSAGYSTLWLAFAAKETGRKVKTFEVSAEKVALARETFRIAQLEDHIDLIHNDFLKEVDRLADIAFCFLDAEKKIYQPCFDAIAGKMVRNGLIVADNATDQFQALKPMINNALKDPRFDCLTVPIGNGEFICRRK
ncbi:O-methyltransferase [Dyadobacter psychrophilus]|uniref:Predicted O-methyltransferase YrrM n=1 Tax=Dyadobacter psychrophilus TaxID=651661 RepID=A0A1T5ERY6_9BACT|nr:class I SAM-dependent methyltransferase [Dyadobacter psychrophilus]SKB86701.1 Predicted O-methyltransferase YrrM [Dyadobacter psychrophilus]